MREAFHLMNEIFFRERIFREKRSDEEKALVARLSAMKAFRF